MTALRWLGRNWALVAAALAVAAMAALAVALQWVTWQQTVGGILAGIFAMAVLWAVLEVIDLRGQADEDSDRTERALALAQACADHLSEHGPQQTGRHADSARSFCVTEPLAFRGHDSGLPDDPGHDTEAGKGHAA